jgi:SsrA-binding protein
MASKKPSKNKSTSVLNRRASFDYALGDELTVGIVLSGIETRSARDGHVQLKGSYVTIRNDELWLNNSSFSLKINDKSHPNRTVDTSARKLLASRKQIDSLIKSKQLGFSVVPVKLLTGGRYIKLIIALGKGKKNYDKRETLKRKQADREASRMMKNR